MFDANFVIILRDKGSFGQWWGLGTGTFKIFSKTFLSLGRAPAAVLAVGDILKNNNGRLSKITVPKKDVYLSKNSKILCVNDQPKNVQPKETIA